MTNDRELLFLSNADVRTTLRWPELLDVTRSALQGIALRDSSESLSTQLAVPTAALHVKGGATSDHQTVTLKANLRPDTGNSDGAILSFNVTEQKLQAVLASGYLTASRTAAIAAVAADTLLTNRQPSVALIGAGPVARSVDEAFTFLELTGELRVWSRSIERARRLIGRRTTPGQRHAAHSIADATAGADLVVSCTPTRTPVLASDIVEAKAVVLAMGADTPGKRELGEGFLDDAVLVADAPSDAVQVGEFSHIPDPDKCEIFSLGELLKSNHVPTTTRRIVLDSVGSPAVDAAVAAMVVDEATREQIGTWMRV